MANYSNFSNEEFDNPFGPPNSGSNQARGSNITPAPLLDSQSKVTISGIQDYNPFEKKDQPATLPTNGSDYNPISAPPPYSKMTATTEELERRQKELESRERELRQREEEIRQRALQGGTAAQPHNWPPLPSFFPIGPCFYQDIDVDIPVEYRTLVRDVYHLWMGHALVFAFNIIAAIAYLVGSSNKSEAGSTFGLSIVFAALFIPLSYTCWFRPLYKAFKNDSSLYFFSFFIIFSAQILVLFLQALGINFFAGCGWINGIGTATSNGGAGAVMLLSAVAFTALIILDVLILMKVHRIYRGSGASFEKAREEFSRGVMSNPTAVNAGASMLSTSISNAASGLRY